MIFRWCRGALVNGGRDRMSSVCQRTHGVLGCLLFCNLGGKVFFHLLRYGLA